MPNQDRATGPESVPAGQPSTVQGFVPQGNRPSAAPPTMQRTYFQDPGDITARQPIRNHFIPLKDIPPIGMDGQEVRVGCLDRQSAAVELARGRVHVETVNPLAASLGVGAITEQGQATVSARIVSNFRTQRRPRPIPPCPNSTRDSRPCPAHYPKQSSLSPCSLLISIFGSDVTKCRKSAFLRRDLNALPKALG